MKVPTLTGTNFEELDLVFTASVRKHNDLIGIQLDCLLRPDAVGNYNLAWNTHEEKIKFCASLQEQAFDDYTEIFYNILV